MRHLRVEADVEVRQELDLWKGLGTARIVWAREESKDVLLVVERRGNLNERLGRVIASAAMNGEGAERRLWPVN
jgi:hypothetical protein